MSFSYWLEATPIAGETSLTPKKAGIVVIGSGLAGTSTAYFLQKHGFDDVLVIDRNPTEAATYRNAGHILYGTVESMKALVEIHGRQKAKELYDFSIECCELVPKTIDELGIKAEYKRDGYLVIANSEVENKECLESIELLNDMGFESQYVDADAVKKLGFKKCFGARYEKGSAQGHPAKFRNGVMRTYLDRGGKYHSNIEVLSIDENQDGVIVKTKTGDIHAEAAVIAANAYSPLFSDYFKSRGLIDPFRGQIVVSKPLEHEFKVTYPHSFDHGYEYGLVTSDNRLLLGGWRNHSPTKEMGIYSLDVNPFIEKGLKDFANEYYDIKEPIEWQYSWSGIMGASKTGMPFIGNTTSPRIYCVAGFTGHGFSWAHGSGKLCADIIAGVDVPKVSRFFNPKTAL
ncbi:MAG: NAD(P)/FAD-dependent oxidoreductase [Bacteriovoracia bacterium]